jgi:PTS system nitrogen regulatory IIA component
MTDLNGILEPSCVRAHVNATSRKRALQFASDLLADHYTGIAARELLDALLERERLGSTGLGEGVAIPHCRLSGTTMMAALITLARPVGFDAPDGADVDLLFVLVVPPEENTAHLEVLGGVAELFSDSQARTRLRAAPDDAALNQVFRAALGGAPRSASA